MFKAFFWKIFLCVAPVTIAALAVSDAFVHKRFKLGVDLVGGTILVYEIDVRKLVNEGTQTQDPKQIANNLAEKLKSRIDPNDLYNVVIRPAGGEGRVEIILPTGGVEEAANAQREWEALCKEMGVKYLLKSTPRVPRGQIQKLSDKIAQLVQQQIWETKLYADENSRKELVKKMLERPTLGEPQHLRPLYEEYMRERKSLGERAVHIFEVGWAGPLFVSPFVASLRTEGLTPGRILDHFDTKLDAVLDYKNKSLQQLMTEVKVLVDDNRKNREIDGWFKQQAWRKMIDLAIAKWPVLGEKKGAFDRIAPDSVEELVGRIETKGDGVGQAFLNVTESIVGPNLLASNAVDDSAAVIQDRTKFLSGEKAMEFVKTYYGPSAAMIEQEIEKTTKSSGQARDLTVEEVQRIKDLVAKVGSLEFNILANNVDDTAGEDDAQAMINNAGENPELKGELELAQNNGLPPPAPRKPGTKEPKVYTIKLRGGESQVTYRWVELGPQERQQLFLHNAALQDATAGGRAQAWSYLAARRGKATTIPTFASSDANDKFLLQGALFYSRECQDRNMPEEERRRKKYEYFILVRNPEIDPATNHETPKIDGSYLVNASNQPSGDGRPAVSFTFNNKGGNLFREVTRKNVPSGEEAGLAGVKRHLAIILDGLVMSAPTINSEISTHGQISGSFTSKEVDNLVNILRAGALPATLKPQPVSENTMGATLGQDTISRGLVAIMVAFVVVLIFMVVYYRFAGLVASVALLANLVLTVGFMVAVKATFTLPGLAGLVLMLGMAVDANILIYERLREEREKGASILIALRNGYDRAFGTIIDTHLSSIFTAVVLYIVGNDQLKGFGISLTVGLLISLYTSLFMTRVLFDLWAAMGWLTKLSMLRLFARPDIDFMTIRYYLFAATGALTILGGALFIGRLPNDLNIDFVGGTAYSGQLIETQAKTIEDLREMLSDKQQRDRLHAHAAEVDERTNRYELWYDDDAKQSSVKRTVSLANKPDGNSAKERADNVAKRASVLPDWAVEQIFLSSAQEKDSSRSRYFTVRSTEKEPELVQATLDRLLVYKDGSNEWKPLLKKVLMDYDNAMLGNGWETRISFYASNPDGTKGDKTDASPSFVTTLLTRELMNAFGASERKDLPFTFELASDDETELGDGRFRVAELAFTLKGGDQSLSSAQAQEFQRNVKDNIRKALDKTVVEFRDRPQPERLETFDSQLAAETRLRAMYAVLMSWAAILLYLWFRFGSWTFGLAAVLCLIHDLFFTLGAIAACHYVNALVPGLLGIEDFKIDLPAVAALLTLVGYSVNDTIVVFDRIREVRGKNPDLTPQMINDSVNQTLSRTILSSLTTWLVVIVLYVAGGPGVHLFAFVMVIGVVVGTYSSIYVASPLLLLFGEGGKAVTRLPSGGPTSPAERGVDVGMAPAAS
jgi:SecD/SecF fusion protein